MENYIIEFHNDLKTFTQQDIYTLKYQTCHQYKTYQIYLYIINFIIHSHNEIILHQ